MRLRRQKDDKQEDDDTLPPEVESAIQNMDPDEKVRAAIRIHLLRQRGVRDGFVKLDDDRIVEIGEAPEE